VTSILNTVINNQLNHNFLGLVAMEWQIFTIARNDVSIFSQSFFNSSFAIWGVMLDKTLWANVTSVVLTCLSNFIAPS
jgi:hypothetical protein